MFSYNISDTIRVFPSISKDIFYHNSSQNLGSSYIGFHYLLSIPKMSEAVFNSFCRLCLRETFSLSNIFSSQSPSGELMYQVLNYVYNLEICPDDGLPPLICAPCSWKMQEFNSYKMNVHFAKEEIVKLLDDIRPKSTISIDFENSVEDCGYSENADTPLESDCNTLVNIKEEIEIEEWQMPEDLKRLMDTEGDGSESLLQADRNIMNIQPESASSEVLSQGIKLELNQEEQIFDQEEAIQTPGSSDLRKILSLEASGEAVGSSFEGESISTTQGISVEMTETNEGIHEEDLRDDIAPEEESLFSEMSKSILDVRKNGRSNIKTRLSKTGLICDICKKSYTGKKHLGNHVRAHYDEKPFSCSKCDKTFKSDYGLYIHELRHLRGKMSLQKSKNGSKKMLYSCDLCAMNFCSKNGLWRHSNMHSNKYKCTSCGRCFGDNGNLKTHIRTHTKEKPFKCEFCLKCFAQKCHLNDHLLSHSSVRPYVCDICDKSFKSKREKTQHALLHLRKE